ncbi:MAG TPA: phosphate ABC transporter permease PstA [Candidatus Nitrosotalea sp.]|nr:phosphate ABC transporter permease PstA [Nitrososphaerota archaeon]HKU32294.1 phosphate ABC transporter permease PstA [Candidatus Nitrosotalea sp.]
MITIEQRAEFRKHFRNNISRRVATDKIVKGIVFGCVLLAIIPLGSILFEIIRNGVPVLSIDFLTQPPGAVGSNQPGGIGPAIQGTLMLIGLSSLIGVPVGVLGGIFLSEYGNNKYGQTIRFFNDVLAEFPTIVIGLFAFAVIVLSLGYFSILAGMFALSIIMLPIITRTTEESLKLVPVSYREAGYALGIKRSVIIFRILLTSAKSGLITGIMLSVARIAGETAPLIFTILGNEDFFSGFDQPVDALPLRIYRLANLPYDSATAQGWGGALVLILIILSLNIGIRYLFLRKRRGGSFRITTGG